MKKRAKVVIAIDGPAGSGKTTAAKLLAKKLGFTYIDTGAMYRAVGLAAKRLGIDPKDERRLKELLSSIKVEFKKVGKDQKILLNDEDVSSAIRTAECGMWASRVSAQGAVRKALVAIQRKLGRNGGIVMEGRDIGTNVFPDAEVKEFLIADENERARRRCRELTNSGEKMSFEKVLTEQRMRDIQDSTRKLNPLAKAPDAVELDTTNLTPDEVARKVIEIFDLKKRRS